MKKLMFLAVLACVGVAFAGSINVPVFWDSAPVPATIPPSSGVVGVIGLHNNTGGAIVCTVIYRTIIGVDRTPAANTFTIPANGSLGWRPVQVDGQFEGTNVGIPDMALPVGDPAAGSAQISWSGGTGQEIQGRYIEYQASGVSAYTLPAGF